MMMNVYLTLDYELFMGKETGTPENCLIIPMKALTEVAESHNARFVIFADAAYLLRMHQLKDKCPQLRNDYELVTANLRDLESRGHDVELHFHPQWLYSDFINETGRWDMDLEHYKLSDMEPSFLKKSFREAKSILDKAIGGRTIAFRAGGYSLNSYPGYAKLLSDTGITIDSSVIGAGKLNTRFQEYDYSNTPDKTKWNFEDDVNYEVDNGLLTEHRITTTPNYPGLFYLLRKTILSKRFGPLDKWGDGEAVNNYLPPFERLKDLCAKLWSGMSFSASIDWLSILELPYILKRAIQNKQDEIVVIGHPKNQSTKSVLYLDKILTEYKNSISIQTFR